MAAAGIVIAGAGFSGVDRALWPGFSFGYWARTRRACRAAYAVTRPGPGS